MEYSIALNTIVYLMLFLFPGILFRKFYFWAAHSKQFDQGNLFERFLWTMLLSIVLLAAVISLFLFLRLLGLPLLDSLSYSTIKAIFDSLSSNELPSETEIENSYFDFFTFISALYLLSVILGLLSYMLNAKLLKFFKYNNYWENVLKGTYKKKRKDSKLFYGYTEADALVETGEGTKLYSGKVVDYFLSQQANQLETIILTGVKRYKKIYDDQGKPKESKVKPIPGDNFCIDNSRILNLNLTYVYEEKIKNSFHKRLCAFIDVLYVFILLGLVLVLYLDLDWILLSSIPKKITFLLFSWLILHNFLDLMKIIVNGQTKKVKTEELLVYILFLIPFLWLTDLISWWEIFIYEFFAFLGIAVLIAIYNKLFSKGPHQEGKYE